MNRSSQLKYRMEPRGAAGDRGTEGLEAAMAALITITVVGAVAGVVCGAFLKICFAIRREDRTKWSLRRDAPSQAAQSARDLVGISSSRWE
jgi:hypothetical protein